MSETVIRTRPWRLPCRGVMVAFAAALCIASCGGGDDPGAIRTTKPTATTSGRHGTAAGTTTSRTTTSSTSRPSTSLRSTSTTRRFGANPAETQVINRYIGFWDARFRANEGTPNPDDPALTEYAAGAQLTTVIAETRRNLADGVAFKARPHSENFRRVKVISITRDRAVVQECFVDDGLVVRRYTGEIVNDKVATHNVRGELIRVDGAWKVSKAQLVQRWEGVAGCASAR